MKAKDEYPKVKLPDFLWSHTSIRIERFAPNTTVLSASRSYPWGIPPLAYTIPEDCRITCD